MSPPIGSPIYDILSFLRVPTVEELLGDDLEDSQSVEGRVRSAARSVFREERTIDPGEEADDEFSDSSSESPYVSSGEEASTSGVEEDVTDSSDDENLNAKTLYRAHFDEASALQENSK